MARKTTPRTAKACSAVSSVEDTAGLQEGKPHLHDIGPEIFAEASPQIEAEAWAIIDEMGATYEIGPGGRMFDLVRHFQEAAAHYQFDIDKLVTHLHVFPVGDGDPIVTAAILTAERFAELEIMHREGLRHAHLIAIEDAAKYGVPVPLWAAQAFSWALLNWSSAHVKTLDEALGVARPKNWDQEAAQKRFRILPDLVERVTKLGRTDAIDDELFEKVGREFNISGSTAKRMYYAHRHQISHRFGKR